MLVYNKHLTFHTHGAYLTVNTVLTFRMPNRTPQREEYEQLELRESLAYVSEQMAF